LNHDIQMKNGTKVFILIHGAQNMLPALCAIKSLNLQNSSLTIYMRQHSLSKERFSTQVSVVRNFFKGLNVDLISLTESEWISFRKGNRSLTKNKKSKDGKNVFLYPHDLTSDTSQVIAKNTNSSINICYGDGYGLLINNVSKVRLSLRFDNLIATIKYIYRSLENRIPHRITPDKFVAILPVSQIQEIPLSMVELVIPEKLMVLEEVIRFHNENIDLESNFVDQITMGIENNPTVLLLLENFSECGFIDNESELQLYKEAVTENVKLGSVINIKSHPWSNGVLAESLSRELSNSYQIRTIHGEVENYPIELWPIDFSRTDVISMSTPAISLEYLFNKRVVQPLNMEKVIKYFKPEFFQILKMQIELIDNPVANLSNWDMKSFLYVTHER